MNIASLLKSVPEPRRPAIIFPGSTKAAITFGELEERSSRLAQGFYEKGVRANDRAIILTPVSINLYASLIALFKLGATAVFLDPQSGYRQLSLTAARVEASALICTRQVQRLRYCSGSLRRIQRMFLSEGDGTGSLDSLSNGCAPRSEIAEVEGETPALITFTGGSTDSSGPRGVVRTHRLLIAQHHALSRALPAIADDVDLPAFPVVTLHNLASGVPSVIPDFPFRRPSAVRPEKILKQIRDFGATTASGSPAYWYRIAEYCLQNEIRLSLRRIVTGGAPVSPALMRQIRKAAPEAEILSIYGSTEAEPVAVIRAEEFLDAAAGKIEPGSGIPLGRVVPEARVRILDGLGKEKEKCQVGEIWVSGEHVARDYLENPSAKSGNKLIDAEGCLWHRMGDVGHLDEAGRLWLDGRVNTVVIRDGTAIYPVHVENLAAMFPYVHRAALIGVPDKSLGDRTRLVVELARGVERPRDWREQLKAACGGDGWIIDEVYAIRRLPVDARHNSRIDYLRLKSRRFIQ